MVKKGQRYPLRCMVAITRKVEGYEGYNKENRRNQHRKFIKGYYRKIGRNLQ